MVCSCLFLLERVGMFTSKTYKRLLFVCLVAMAMGLAAEAALSLGYFVEKWSANSLALGIGIAVAIGVLMIAAIYFAGGMLAAKYREANEGLESTAGSEGLAV